MFLQDDGRRNAAVAALRTENREACGSGLLYLLHPVHEPLSIIATHDCANPFHNALVLRCVEVTAMLAPAKWLRINMEGRLARPLGDGRLSHKNIPKCVDHDISVACCL